jgi:colanic acid biosynthesis protein WcaH
MIPEDIYAQIVNSMPIPCVDLLVEDEQGRVLLVKRASEPAKGHWWFPGGRIHYLETRAQAASRKLREECRLEVSQLAEMGTYDVILAMPDDLAPRHGITTLFHIIVKNHKFSLNDQSLDADWRLPSEWEKVALHEFIWENLKRIQQESILR